MINDSRAARAAVVAIWEDTVGAAPAASDVSFFEAGGDSRAAVRLLDSLRGRLGATFSLRAFFAAPTVDGLVEALMAGDYAPAAHRPTGGTVAHLRPTGHEVLWCFFPPLSGMATSYVRMARLLPPGHGVWGCNTPLERGDGDLDDLTRVLVAALLDEGMDTFGQVHLAGYSLGGALALEVAHALAEGGSAPDWLGDVFLLDPSPPGDAPAIDKVLEIFIRRNWGITEDPLSFFAADGTLDAARVVHKAREAGMLEAAASEDDVRESWTTYMANRVLLDGYQPRPLPDRRPWLLSCGPAPGPEPAPVDGDAGPWAVVTVPERCYQMPVEHSELVLPPNDALVADWMVDAARHAPPR
jgi:thioesterase domain-containing protein